MNDTRHRGPNPFEGSGASFSESFPEIQNLKVTATQYEYDSLGGRRSKGSRTYTKETVGRFIRCLNPQCHRGGFDLEAMLRHMVAARTGDAERTAICQGTERSPKGRKIYGHCLNHFTVNAAIEYKAI